MQHTIRHGWLWIIFSRYIGTESMKFYNCCEVCLQSSTTLKPGMVAFRTFSNFIRVASLSVMRGIHYRVSISAFFPVVPVKIKFLNIGVVVGYFPLYTVNQILKQIVINSRKVRLRVSEVGYWECPTSTPLIFFPGEPCDEGQTVHRLEHRLISVRQSGLFIGKIVNSFLEFSTVGRHHCTKFGKAIVNTSPARSGGQQAQKHFFECFVWVVTLVGCLHPTLTWSCTIVVQGPFIITKDSSKNGPIL